MFVSPPSYLKPGTVRLVERELFAMEWCRHSTFLLYSKLFCIHVFICCSPNPTFVGPTYFALPTLPLSIFLTLSRRAHIRKRVVRKAQADELSMNFLQ